MKQKKLFALLLSATLIAFCAGSSCAADRILIAYFSRVGNTPFSASTDTDTHASTVASKDGLQGNTEAIARMIQAATGGDLYLIKTDRTYPVSYDDTLDEAQKEARVNARPGLASPIPDMGTYDTVFIGYPNWWGDLPMAVYAFLENADLSGKTLIPFVTSGGSGFSRTQRTISELAPRAKVLKGLAIRDSRIGSAQREVQEWIKGLQL